MERRAYHDQSSSCTRGEKETLHLLSITPPPLLFHQILAGVESSSSRGGCSLPLIPLSFLQSNKINSSTFTAGHTTRSRVFRSVRDSDGFACTARSRWILDRMSTNDMDLLAGRICSARSRSVTVLSWVFLSDRYACTPFSAGWICYDLCVWMDSVGM